MVCFPKCPHIVFRILVHRDALASSLKHPNLGAPLHNHPHRDALRLFDKKEGLVFNIARLRMLWFAEDQQIAGIWKNSGLTLNVGTHAGVGLATREAHLNSAALSP